MKKLPRNTEFPPKWPSRSRPDEGPVWIWGSHAVAALVANPARRVRQLMATENAARRLGLVGAQIVAPRDVDRQLPVGAVHQGVAALADPLEPADLADIIAAGVERIAVLDQITDPHNLGAIFRSAAAFGFGAMVLQTRHAPAMTGVVAKSAAGAIETVAEVRVVNIARALDALKDADYLCVGLAGEAGARVPEVFAGADRVAVVLGAEGDGLRPAVAGACSTLARIAIHPAMESLNVSNAAAIAFFAAAGERFAPG